MTTSFSRRHLPVVKNARKRAQDCHYYKTRSNTYQSDIELKQNMAQIEKDYFFNNAKNEFEQMEMRMEIIHMIQEEKEFLLDDCARFDIVDEKIQRQRMIMLQEKLKRKRADKIKPQPPRQPFKKQEQREPQLKVNLSLVYPQLELKKTFKTMYYNNFLRPMESRLGEKCVQWIQNKYTTPNDEDEIIAELVGKKLPPITGEDNVNATSTTSKVQANFQEGALGEKKTSSQEEVVFVSQLEPNATRFPPINERNIYQSLVKPIQEMRQMLRYWDLPANSDTQERLKQCKKQRKRRILKRSTLPSVAKQDDSKNHIESDTSDSSSDEDESEAGKGDPNGVRLPKIKETSREEDRQSVISSASSNDSADEEERRLVNKLRQITQEVRNKRRKGVIEGNGLSPIASEGVSREPTMLESESGEAKVNAELTDMETVSRRHSLKKSLSKMKLKNGKKISRVALPTEEDVEIMTPEQLAEFHETWKQVLQCRYLRGYDPPEMKLPTVPIGDFVFDKKTPIN